MLIRSRQPGKKEVVMGRKEIRKYGLDLSVDVTGVAS